MTSEERTNPVVVVNGKSVDLSPALPLLLEDWLKLEEVGVTIETMQKATLKVMHELAKFVIHKADASVTADDILKLRMAQLRDIFAIVGEAEVAELNRPSTTSST